MIKDRIWQRKSTRSYLPDPLGEDMLLNIRGFIDGIRPLHPGIRVRFEIVGQSGIRNLMPWSAPHYIAFFSEEAEGDLENAGFMLQQLDLFLQELGLGACWLGMGRPGGGTPKETDGMRFVIAMAFGRARGDAYRASGAFKRKALSQISDREDPRLEPARLAPSSINSQPWYFTHEGDKTCVHCVRSGLIRARMLSDMNRIDMGICLAHLYICNPDTFQFFAESGDGPRGYACIGSIRL